MDDRNLIDDIQSQILALLRQRGVIYTELTETGLRFSMGDKMIEVRIKEFIPPANKNRTRRNTTPLS